MTTITTNRTTLGRSSRFYWRSFFSLFLLSTLALLSLTGIALYVAPSGRVAETIVWRFVWLDKTQWEAMHTVFSFLWIPVAVAHTALNWKPILAYVHDRARKAFAFKRELAWATILTVFFTVASVTNWPPVAQVMAFGEWFTTYWENQGRAAGYYVPTETEAHTITVPANTASSGSSPTASAGTLTVVAEKRGVGRFTVLEVAQDAKLSVEEALARLEKLGVKASADEKLLALSGRSGYSPLDLDSIIRGKPLNQQAPTVTPAR
jgi:hypothetical protein